MELEERRYFKRDDGLVGQGTLVHRIYRESIRLTARKGCADETKRVMYCGLSESAQITYFMEPLDRNVTISLGGPASWDTISADNRFTINITSSRDSFVNHGSFDIGRDGNPVALSAYTYKTFHDSIMLSEEVFYNVVEFFPYPRESKKNNFFLF